MQLEQFLVKAKTRTYASGGEGGERILEDGGRAHLSRRRVQVSRQVLWLEPLRRRRGGLAG